MDISILVYILAFIVVILILWIIFTEYRFRNFFAGTDAKNLEGVMTNITKELSDIEKIQIKTIKHLDTVDKRLNKSIRSIEMIRFNPFEDAGSNQSFAISLVNDEGDGVILSSLYARDRMSVFAKPVNKWDSKTSLSDEEKEVLEKSK